MTGDALGNVNIIDTVTGAVKPVAGAHSAPVTIVSASAMPLTALSGAQNGSVLLWTNVGQDDQ